MKKWKSQKGFTLAEMLICVVILILLAGLCNTGTNLAMRSYNESLFESNSQMLESTLNMYLGDIVRHAELELETTLLMNPIESGNKGIKSITNSDYGMYEGQIVLEDGRIYVYKLGVPSTETPSTETPSTETPSTEADNTRTRLISDKVYTNALKISDFRLEYNETGKYVAGRYTIESTILSGLKRECNFKYKVVVTD